MQSDTRGRVHSIQVSDGGVPKLPVPEAQVEAEGLISDRQRHRKFHGGPERAVCLLGLDVIERLRAAGHPIVPGATGENLTLEGLSWSELQPGDRFVFEGGLRLVVRSHASPCPAIAAAFKTPADIVLLDHRKHPGQARLYAAVEEVGSVRVGEGVWVERPSP